MSDQHRLRVQAAQERLVCIGDELRLERVLTNLLTNAITYSPDGGDVVVTVYPADHNAQPGAIVSVCDKGIGIPAADLPHLFESFRRGSNVTHTQHGSGLGLASVQRIVAQHGGTIDIQSEENMGSTFFVWLPFDRSPGDAPDTEDHSPSATRAYAATGNHNKTQQKASPGEAHTKESMSTYVLIDPRYRAV